MKGSLADKLKDFLGINLVDIDYIAGSTFFSELNAKARPMVIPSAIIAFFAWIPFMQMDKMLYPQHESIILLRWALPVASLITIFLYTVPSLRKKSYYLMLFLLFVIAVSAALILAVVKGDPIYMAGYSIVILLIPLAPFERIHASLLILLSLTIFFVFGIKLGMGFESPEYMYGLANIIVSFFISFMALYFLDRERKNAYGKTYLIQQTNEALESSNLENIEINRELETIAHQLSAANTELQILDKKKSEFLRIAAHDLRNPLQIILGYVELLESEMGGTEKNRKKLKKIETSVEHMITIISELLDKEKIENGKFDIKKTHIKLNSLLEMVIERHKLPASKKNQSLSFGNDNDIFYFGDLFILQQVFENLINNAIKFSSLGGKIHITIKREYTYILVGISDEGPGLTKEDFSLVFQKFKPLSAKPTGGESSSGLGLAIVKKYVEIHGGTVYVENNETKGATFFVKLPFPIENPS